MLSWLDGSLTPFSRPTGRRLFSRRAGRRRTQGCVFSGRSARSRDPPRRRLRTESFPRREVGPVARAGPPQALVLLATGAGAARTDRAPGPDDLPAARSCRTDARFSSRLPSPASRSASGFPSRRGKPRLVLPEEATGGLAPSPDGKKLALHMGGGRASSCRSTAGRGRRSRASSPKTASISGAETDATSSFPARGICPGRSSGSRSIRAGANSGRTDAGGPGRRHPCEQYADRDLA